MAPAGARAGPRPAAARGACAPVRFRVAGHGRGALGGRTVGRETWGGSPLTPTLVAPRTGARRELWLEANRARHRGQLRRALALYRSLLLESPRDIETALLAAPLLARQGEAFEAWQLFRMAASELHRERRFDASLAALREACRC